MPSSKRSISRYTLALPLLIAVVLTPIRLPAQSTPDTPACTLQKGVYTCNWQAFHTALDSAHTVRIETQGLDRSTAAQLRHLAAQFGKTVATGDQPADLIFLLVPVAPNGIDFGPAAHDLATLRIYAPAPARSHGALLWAETYRGDPDRPWPAIANATIQQFQSRFSKR